MRALMVVATAFFLSLDFIHPSFAQENEITVELDRENKLVLLLIPQGEFEQGSPESESGRADDETLRQVKITNDFYLGKYPVTRQQFGAFVQATNYRTEAEIGTSGGYGWVDGKFVQRPEFNWKNPGFPQTDDHPVTCITYFDALAFLDWVSQKSKHTLRLPSEAEWEYACRAGTKEAFYWGENSKNAAEHAWFKENSRTGTQPVGTKPANPWGLHDMTGNVYQWCLDWYAPYDASLLENPIQQRSDLSDKPRRVLRGGAFHRDVKHLRSSARYRNDPRSRNADNGFRVVMELETAASKTSQSIIPPASLPVPTAAPRTAVVNTPTIQNEPALPVEVTPVNEHIPVRTVSSNSLPLGLMCCLLSGLLVIGAPLLLFLWLRSGKQDQYETTIRSLDRNEQGDAIPILPMKSADSPFQSSRDNRIRMGVDGFWILIKDLAQGTRLEYRYDAANVAHFDQLRVEPGPPEVFVYTGDTPTNCEITNLLPPESEPLLRDTFPDILPIPTATPPRSRPSEKQPLDRTSGGTFDGYPSAY